MATAQPGLTTESVATTVEIDWARAVRIGLLMGLSLVFIAAIGMLETFNRRPIIVPILSLGYLAIGWIPPLLGYHAATVPHREGMPEPPRSIRRLLPGLVAGLIGGGILWLLAAAMNAVNLRDIFVKLSPALFDLLTFERGLGFGVISMILGAGLLGLLGAAGTLLNPRLRRAIAGALSWMFIIAILEPIFIDMLEDARLSFVTDFIYELNGGLTVVGAIAVLLVAGFVSYRYAGAAKRYRARLQTMEPDEKKRHNTRSGLVLLAVVAVLPWLMGSLMNELFANVGLFLLMGLGLNIVVGYAGLLDLGYVAFFAVGAYTTAVLTSPISPGIAPMLTVDFLSWEGWAVLGAVLAMATIAGLLVGTPVIRMRGDYLAIVTLGFGEIVRILFLSDWLSPAFGGAQGVRQVPAAELGPLGITITGIDPRSIFYFVAVFVTIAIYVSWRLSKSRVGRAWAAMREDESVAEAMGIDTVKAKLMAFVVGAILASLGGMVFAIKVGSVFPSSFGLLVSIIVLVVVIVGGMGNIPGVIVGAVVLIGVLGGPTQPGVLQEFQEFKLLIYGALLVYMMLQRPEGLLPSASRSRELHQDEMHQDAWLSSALDGDDANTEEASP